MIFHQITVGIPAVFTAHWRQFHGHEANAFFDQVACQYALLGVRAGVCEVTIEASAGTDACIIPASS
jgi:hypothetical protein